MHHAHFAENVRARCNKTLFLRFYGFFDEIAQNSFFGGLLAKKTYFNRSCTDLPS